MTGSSSTARSSMGGVARGGTLNAVGAAVSAVLGFFVTYVIARGYSQDLAGVFFSSTSAFIVLVAVGQLGTNVGLVYFISRTRAVGRPDLVPSYLRAASVPVLVWSVALAGALFFFASSVGGLISADQERGAASAIRILAPFIIVASVENLAVSATRGLGTMRPTALLTLVVRPLAQLVLVLLTLLLARPEASVLAWATGYVVSALAAVVWAHRLLARRTEATAPGGRVAKQFWRFTAPRAVVTIAQIAMQRLDIVLVGALAGAAPAAIYAATTRFLVAGQMSTQSVGLAAQPRFAHYLAIDDRSSTESLYRISTAWLVLFAWPVYLTLAIFSDTVLRAFGSAYVDGAPVLRVLAGALMFGAVVGVVEVVLVMAGRSMWTLVNSLIAFAVLLGLDVWLIPRWGILGAAAGWGTAIVVRNCMALIQVWSTLRLHPFGRASALSALIAVVGVGVPLAAARVVLGDGVPALVGGMGAAFVCFVAAAWLFRSTLRVPELLASLRRRPSA